MQAITLSLALILALMLYAIYNIKITIGINVRVWNYVHINNRTIILL